MRVAWVAIALLAAAACTPAPAKEAARTVEVFGPYLGQEADRFADAMRPFEERTGIGVEYVGSASYADELLRRVNDASPPDVAIVPQPGAIASFDRSGLVQPLSEPVRRAMTDALIPEVAELGVIDGTSIAVPYRLFVKSLVWYDPALFDANGWEVPATLGELGRLTDQIADSGLAPWCFGIAAFGSTGFIVTDWIEDVLLRTAGPDVYDGWVVGDVDFADPVIEESFEYVSDLLLEDGHVLGGAPGIARTPAFDAVLPLLEPEPRCAMHRNSNVIIDRLPDGLTIGPDGDLDVFVLPPATEGSAPPLVTAADFAIAMTDAPEAQLLLEYLATPDAGRAWAVEGGYVGGRIAETEYQTPFAARLVRMVTEAEVVRGDGSDAMDPAFGTTPFWSLLAQWVNGAIGTDEVLALLDETRDVATSG